MVLAVPEPVHQGGMMAEAQRLEYHPKRLKAQIALE
jgi:hypothetical protein